MVYLPGFGCFFIVNVGQYIIHGCYGAMGTNVIIKGNFVSGHYLLLSHPKEFNTVYLYQLCRWFGEWQSRIGRATGSGLGCTATLQTRVFVVGIPFNVFWIHHHHKGLRGLEYDDVVVVVVVVVVELFVSFCFFLVIFKRDLHRKPCCLHEDPIGVTAELCKVVHLNLNPKSGIWRPRSYGSIDRAYGNTRPILDCLGPNNTNLTLTHWHHFFSIRNSTLDLYLPGPAGLDVNEMTRRSKDS